MMEYKYVYYFRNCFFAFGSMFLLGRGFGVNSLDRLYRV
jgi:hypothetical protein